ncbi:MAG TPA: methyltransferase domain-containing protein [Acidimicrobiales bacterium]|jgi:SAM-dependent methyltransferase|nr:methyltransferase domain-containing protein [Acidimicrobiales bacterium]
MTRREGLGTDASYLREKQYKDPTNLNARIALHVRFAKTDEPWYPWLAGLVDWPEDGEVLEVGCGPGLLWGTIAPLLPRLHLTLTDLSEGMLDAARSVVAPIDSLELVATTACDAQELPYPDATFDVVVANHMLYHVPEPIGAASEFARVLRPDGVLLAATNGANHLDVMRQIERQVFGWSSSDFVDQHFGRTSGRTILATSFEEVAWHQHPSTLVCDDPIAVVASIRSSRSGQEATPEQLAALDEAVASRFRADRGVVTMSMDSGCFVARRPAARAARN